MADYDVTFTCGHVLTVRVRGREIHGARERAARIVARLSAGACGDCDPLGDRVQAPQWCGENGFIIDKGSSRQIAWAKELCMVFIEQRLPWEIEERVIGGELTGDVRELVETHVEAARTLRDAAWWIRYRGSPSVACYALQAHAKRIAQLRTVGL